LRSAYVDHIPANLLSHSKLCTCGRVVVLLFARLGSAASPALEKIICSWRANFGFNGDGIGRAVPEPHRIGYDFAQYF